MGFWWRRWGFGGVDGGEQGEKILEIDEISVLVFVFMHLCLCLFFMKMEMVFIF